MKTTLMLLFSFFIVCLLVIQTACSFFNSPKLSGGYQIKNGKVYYTTQLQGMGTRKSWEISQAHSATFQSLDKGFAKDKKQAYFRGRLIPESDGPSFGLLRNNYAADKHHVYLGDQKISDDPQNFRFIRSEGELSYTADSRFVYKNGEIIPGADATTFESLQGVLYFRDKNTAYREGIPLADAHSPSFQVLSKVYAKDKKQVWFLGQPMVFCDPASFKPMDYPYSRDVHRVFYMNKILSRQPDQFELLGEAGMWRFAKDGSAVYFGGSVLEEADPEYFQVMSHAYALNPIDVYYGKHVVPLADPNFFEVLNKKYSKDNERVYYEGRLVDGADAATFAVHPTIENEAKDKDRYYKSGQAAKTGSW